MTPVSNVCGRDDGTMRSWRRNDAIVAALVAGVRTQAVARARSVVAATKGVSSDKAGVAMQQILEQTLHFVKAGIAAIFRFVELIWNWSSGQIAKVIQAPWQSWPLWKQILLAVVAAGVGWILYRAITELWESGERALVAFTGLLGAFVRTLPKILVAGLIALGGIWVINNVDPSAIALPSRLQLGRG